MVMVLLFTVIRQPHLCTRRRRTALRTHAHAPRRTISRSLRHQENLRVIISELLLPTHGKIRQEIRQNLRHLCAQKSAPASTSRRARALARPNWTLERDLIWLHR